MAAIQELTFKRTHFMIAPLMAKELKLCFAPGFGQPQYKNNYIGYLEGDFGLSGKEFHYTWNAYQNLFFTQSFRCELRNIVRGLKQNGLLADRSTMAAHIARHHPAVFTSFGRKELAFRITTKNRLYFLRCVPYKGEHNFYIFCYNQKGITNNELYN